jgi:transposase
MTKIRWTAAEDKYVTLHHGDMTAQAISERLGRSLSAVQYRIATLRKHGADIPAKAGSSGGEWAPNPSCEQFREYPDVPTHVRITSGTLTSHTRTRGRTAPCHPKSTRCYTK